MQLARFIIPYRKSNLAMEIPQISKTKSSPSSGSSHVAGQRRVSSTHQLMALLVSISQYIPIYPIIFPWKNLLLLVKASLFNPFSEKNHPIFSPWHMFCFFHWPLRGFWGEDRQRLLPTEALGWWEVEGCRVYPWQLWSGEVVVGSC